MPDLFQTQSILAELTDNNSFSQEQRDFISKVLNGTDQWNNLETLAHTVDTEQLNHLKAALKEEISKVRNLPFQKRYKNNHYYKLLKSIVSNVEGILDYQEYLKTFYQNKKDDYNNFAKRHNSFYQSSVKTYRANLMLPVLQGLDARLGNSDGVCFAYVTTWAIQILTKERPFGLSVNQEQTLQPLPFNHVLVRQNPSINHFGVYTKKISEYADISDKQLKQKLSAIELNSSQQANNDSIKFKNSIWVFYQSTTEIAQSLVNAAQTSPNSVYSLLIQSFSMKHGLGFCLIDDKYHFFDANVGWFRFNNDKDFIKWFPYYYKKIGYETFKEYGICSFSRSTKPAEDIKIQKSALYVIFRIAFTILLSPIIAVFYVIKFINVFINIYIIRSLRYLAFEISQYFCSKDIQQEAEDVEETDWLSNVTLTETISPSLAALDINNTKKIRLRTKNALDYLDLSVTSLEQKNDFKSLNANAFFNKSRNIPISENISSSSILSIL
ncbi:hypothetical protein ACFORL_12315 [Legionella dresdenensis]|uniref:Uncharacterized protein n=1 Tax=Legionella dresdenensis TaxID=450200 RepID=A0ABV8CIH1_9GAMM